MNNTFSQLRGILNLNDLAFCPWTYTIDYNEKRIPQVLPKVICRNNCCLDNMNSLRRDVVCTPFSYKLLVLKQTDGDECFQGRKSTLHHSFTFPSLVFASGMLGLIPPRATIFLQKRFQWDKRDCNDMKIPKCSFKHDVTIA